jgi:two-component system, cell cycle sensor histidine kinase and response regulator CckA
MSWLLPAVTANISSAILLTLLYLYLYLQDRQRYLKIWMFSWAVYSLRFVLNLFLADNPPPILLLTTELAHLASGVLLLYGSYIFINKPFPRAWLAGTILTAAWLPMALVFNFSFQATILPVFLFLGTVFIWTGTVFLRLREITGWGRIVLGCSLILWGIHKLNYPILRPLDWVAPWGYLIASLLGLTVALGVILVYFEKTRKDLQLSEERFRLLAENARDVIYRLRVRPGLAFDYISPAIVSFTGRHPEEYYANPDLLFKTVHPEDLPRLKEMLQAEASGPVVLRWLDDRGRTTWVEQQNTPIVDGQNKLVAIEGIVRDITSRIYAEERTLQLQKHHTLILESIGEGIFGLDREGRATFINPAAARMLAWPLEALIGKKIHAHGHAVGHEKSPPPESTCAYLATLNDGITRQGRDLFRRRDGTSFPAEYTCVPIRTAGSNTGVVVTFQDITAREKAEADKKKLHDQLLQSQKVEAIGQLAGGVAHDFNNLLMAINGYGQLILQQLGPDSPLRQDINEILKAGERAAALTRQLLAFSRRQPLQPRVVNLKSIIGDMEKMLHRLIGEDIHFKTSFAPDLQQVNVDPGQMEQVVMNLVVNARDAMPDGGKLTIRAADVDIDEEYCRLSPNGRPGQFVCLAIEDTGTGMSQEMTGRIFEPFFSTKGREGTGLGLSVVYGIIKQHEGWITVYSEPDQGTTFRIYLPALADGRANGDGRALAAFHASQGRGERILIAEDEEKVRQLVSRILSANGYRIETAASVTEALAVFAREGENFDLLFTDVVLPDRSGLQLIEELLASKPALKILVTSGYTDHKSQWPRIRDRGYRFLEKPYGLNLLLQTVREVLDS